MSSYRGHPVFARVYAPLSRLADEGGMAAHRQRLVAGLRGEVLEVGAGNGRSFAHYPSAVTRVLAVEPEPYLRRLAHESARSSAAPVEVVAGTAEALPTGAATMDAAVVSLVLCSVPDQDVALAELRRVLRPGGELRFLEHVRAETPGLRRVQGLLDATVWPTLGGGCHLGRDTVAAIRSAGFEVGPTERFRLPDGPVPAPSSPHVRGTATAPVDT